MHNPAAAARYGSRSKRAGLAVRVKFGAASEHPAQVM
jgi:hypothetical protein